MAYKRRHSSVLLLLYGMSAIYLVTLMVCFLSRRGTIRNTHMVGVPFLLTRSDTITQTNNLRIKAVYNKENHDKAMPSPEQWDVNSARAKVVHTLEQAVDLGFFVVEYEAEPSPMVTSVQSFNTIGCNKIDTHFLRSGGDEQHRLKCRKHPIPSSQAFAPLFEPAKKQVSWVHKRNFVVIVQNAFMTGDSTTFAMSPVDQRIYALRFSNGYRRGLNFIPYPNGSSLTEAIPWKSLSSRKHPHVHTLVPARRLGWSYYHVLAEQLFPLMYHRALLDATAPDPTSIHVSGGGGHSANIPFDFLRDISWPSEHILTGPVTAKTVQLHGGPYYMDIQANVAREMASFMKDRLGLSTYCDQRRDPNVTHILFIQRMRSRNLRPEKGIVTAFYKAAETQNVPIQIHWYRDNISHDTSDTIRLFCRADIILAPHGAGLANLIYAPPHATVIEVLGTEPFRHGLNLCFAQLSYFLHLHYIGFGTIATHTDLRLNRPELEEFHKVVEQLLARK